MRPRSHAITTRAFVDQYARAWARADARCMAELWAHDAELVHPELNEPLRGRPAIMRYMAKLLEIAPDLTVRPLAAAANGRTVFIHFHAEGTFDGDRLTWEGVDVFELDGLQAIRGTGFFDTAVFGATVGGFRDAHTAII